MGKSRKLEVSSATPASIDTKLDKTEEKILGKGPFGFKVENGSYRLTYGSIALQTPINDPDVLSKIANLTSKILNIYQNEGSNGEFFQRESWWTRGGNDPIMLLQLDDSWIRGNGTTYLTEEGYMATFLSDEQKKDHKISRKNLDPSRTNGLVQSYADFLNAIKGSFTTLPNTEKPIPTEEFITKKEPVKYEKLLTAEKPHGKK